MYGLLRRLRLAPVQCKIKISILRYKATVSGCIVSFSRGSAIAPQTSCGVGNDVTIAEIIVKDYVQRLDRRPIAMEDA